jgi:hypothetical protein
VHLRFTQKHSTAKQLCYEGLSMPQVQLSLAFNSLTYRADGGVLGTVQFRFDLTPRC